MSSNNVYYEETLDGFEPHEKTVHTEVFCHALMRNAEQPVI